MGSIFRSRDMAFCEVFFQSETAFNCVAALGELGVVQFNDMSALNASQKPKFIVEIRRIDEMERKLHFIETEIEKSKIQMPDHIDNPPVLQPRDISKLETKLDELQSKLTEMDSDLSSMKQCQLELTERLLAIEMTAPYLTDINLSNFQQNEPNANTRPTSPSSRSEAQATLSNLNFLVGVIARERSTGFERMIWRLAGNNVYVRTFAVTNSDVKLKDPKTGRKLLLNVFIAIFEGEMLRDKILNVCNAFHAHVYPCPEHPDDRGRMCQDIRPRINEMTMVLKQAAEIRHQLLTTAARDIRMWKVQLRKVKTVYFMMNMLNLDVTKRYFIGHCWTPVEDLKKVEEALHEATKTTAGELLVPFIINQILPASTNDVPTYFPTNCFTQGFQAIVDAFGVARYHEINPGLFTVITFPFLFSIMFSDAGHGVILLLFALWLIFKERAYRKYTEKSETLEMIMGGRYVILLMGIFSIYAGFMFNEFFGRSVNLFQSRWHSNISDATMFEHSMDYDDHMALDPSRRANVDTLPYPFGVDPIWYMASNRIVFTNSLKMKISVIFGVAHMFFGVILSLGNHLYFRHFSSIMTEFVPQILLISCMFVYMDALIVYKWIAFDADNGAKAPSILLGMINMFMLQYPNETEADHFVNTNLKQLQMVLVCIWAACVPWLLLAKPLYFLRKSKQPMSCRDAGPSRLISRSDSTPIPVLSRSGQQPGLLSPTAKPFLGQGGGEVIELTEVEPRIFTISPKPGDEASSSLRFSNLFANDITDNTLPVPPAFQRQTSQSSPNLRKELSEKTASNDTIIPTSPQTSQVQLSKLGQTGGKTVLPSLNSMPGPIVHEPSITFSPFPPVHGYREKLDESISKKDEPDTSTGHFDFGEVFMLQMIHTIEYVLGLISHTASYLRLWALSLAHAELSEVLWMMILRAGFSMAAQDSKFGFIYVAIALLVWTLLTFAVLIFMEAMSAFLHALRLHWVEFQSKFYNGSGRSFQPFSFKNMRQHLSSSSSVSSL